MLDFVGSAATTLCTNVCPIEWLLPASLLSCYALRNTFLIVQPRSFVHLLSIREQKPATELASWLQVVLL